jgi:hypothetical protein
MATDRDEQQRQQQELEEIRRSFAEMGARMGSLFEPAEIDQEDQSTQAAPPAAPPASTLALSTAPERPRWWAAAVLTLVFLAGGLFGFILPRSQSADPESPAPASVTTASRAEAAIPPPATQPPRTKTSVPEECLEAAELADEIISRLNRNIRDNRLATALVEFTAANQACRKEASP